MTVPMMENVSVCSTMHPEIVVHFPAKWKLFLYFCIRVGNIGFISFRLGVRCCVKHCWWCGVCLCVDLLCAKPKGGIGRLQIVIKKPNVCVSCELISQYRQLRGV